MSDAKSQRPNAEHDQRVIDDWDALAHYYDSRHSDVGNDWHRNLVLPTILKLLGDVQGKRGVDLCCGSGVLARQLVELGAKVIGADQSKAFLSLAEQHDAPISSSHQASKTRSPSYWASASDQHPGRPALPLEACNLCLHIRHYQHKICDALKLSPFVNQGLQLRQGISHRDVAIAVLAPPARSLAVGLYVDPKFMHLLPSKSVLL